MTLKDRLRPRWLKTLRKIVASRLKLAALQREFGLPPLCANPLAATKRSDTLFVLGSGASINRLDAAQWREIGEHDSVGFNFWLVHDFVPSAYVFEPPKAAADMASLVENLAVRAGDYARTTMIVKDGERHREDDLRDFLRTVTDRVGRRLLLSWDWEPAADDPGAFARRLRLLDRFGLLTGARFPAVRKRASVFFLTLLALRAGYRRIVLCGIDLNNTEYFYDALRAELTAKGRNVPAPRRLAAAQKTDDPRFGALTISTALDALNREVLRPRGIALYVAFDSSALHPLLPSYFGAPAP